MRTYKQLTQEQRYQIYALKKAGHCQMEIANLLGVHKSTICRELRRNRGQRGYRPKQAHGFALTASAADVLAHPAADLEADCGEIAGRLEPGTDFGLVVAERVRASQS